MTDDESVKFSRGQQGGAGLVNMQSGLVNVCYQNSILQSLFSSNKFLSSFVTAPLAQGAPVDVEMASSEQQATSLSAAMHWQAVWDMDVGLGGGSLSLIPRVENDELLHSQPMDPSCIPLFRLQFSRCCR